MTKQEKIIEAYGDFYPIIQKYLYTDGWLDKLVFKQTELKYETISDLDFEHDGSTFCRPKSLIGIETNNGWLPYINEKLPKNKDYHVTNKKGDMVVLSSNVLNSLSEANLINITHYQEVIKPEKPIY